MPTKTTTLIEFLLARIAEDAEAALTASNGPWLAATMYPTRSEVLSRSSLVDDGVVARTPRKDDADVEHIARHDPTRVLAECEAKRRVVEQCGPVAGGYYPCTSLAQDTLIHLGGVYADHPDYREEWRA